MCDDIRYTDGRHTGSDRNNFCFPFTSPLMLRTTNGPDAVLWTLLASNHGMDITRMGFILVGHCPPCLPCSGIKYGKPHPCHTHICCMWDYKTIWLQLIASFKGWPYLSSSLFGGEPGTEATSVVACDGPRPKLKVTNLSKLFAQAIVLFL